jgi:hypothetical protein
MRYLVRNICQFGENWASSPFSGGHGLRVLPPILHSSKESMDLFELRFALNRDIDVYHEGFLIRWRIETVDFRADEALIPMSKVKKMTTALQFT